MHADIILCFSWRRISCLKENNWSIQDDDMFPQQHRTRVLGESTPNLNNHGCYKW